MQWMLASAIPASGSLPANPTRTAVGRAIARTLPEIPGDRQPVSRQSLRYLGRVLHAPADQFTDPRDIERTNGRSGWKNQYAIGQAFRHREPCACARVQ